MRETSLSIVANLAGTLRRDISLGLLPPGARLNIEEIKRDRGVSHPSVREALSLLVGEGYVASTGNKGFRVIEGSFEVAQDAARVRAELEALAISWSVAKSTRDWRASVVAAHHALTEAEAVLADDPVGHVLDWDEMNRGFHLALASNCGSPRLLELITHEYDRGRRYRLMAHAADRPADSRADWVRQSSDEHNHLRDAVLDGNAQLATDLIRTHIMKYSSDRNGVLDGPFEKPQTGR